MDGAWQRQQKRVKGLRSTGSDQVPERGRGQGGDGGQSPLGRKVLRRIPQVRPGAGR